MNCKASKRVKKRIWFFCFAIFLLFVFLIYGNEFLLNQIAKIKSPEQEEIFYTTVSFYLWDEVKNEFPDSFIEYLCQAVTNGNMEDQLSQIEADYAVMSNWEKVIAIAESTDTTLANFQYYFGNEEDEWYRISLYEKDDIVIRHVFEDGSITSYAFLNYEHFSTEALRTGGKGANVPYFIQWEDQNYIAFPCENVEENIKRGLIVYDYSVMGVVGIGLKEDGTIDINYQTCSLWDYGGTMWPIVVREDEK